MTQLSEAIARYHKILEQDRQSTAGWADQFRQAQEAKRLVVNGRPVSPVLRPHFISRRQYTNLAKTAESLQSAVDRVRQMALTTPALMSRMEMLPAEKMLAALDPGYTVSSVSSLFQTHVNNGSVHFTECRAELPNGVVYGELLSDLYYDSAPVKEFRKKYKVAKSGGTKPLVQAVLKAFKEFGGKKVPSIAVLEFLHPFQTAESHEHSLLVEVFRKHGYESELVSPDQLEYRNGVLRRGEFAIDLIYRGVKAHEFLLRFDLNHPLVRAYRERKVCIVNSFRSEIERKKAIFALLTDDQVVSSFPLAERKAIKEAIPWTRVVSQTKTLHNGQSVDLPAHILANRENLVLRPNDDSSELHSYDGSLTDAASWERALKQALRNPYVVQERVNLHPIPFPVDFYGDIVMRDLNVDVHPHTFLGKVQGCSSTVTSANATYSTMSGIAPTFILEGR